MPYLSKAMQALQDRMQQSGQSSGQQASLAADVAKAKLRAESLTGERGANRAIRQSDFRGVGTVTLRIDSSSFYDVSADEKARMIADDIKDIRDALLALAKSTGAVL